MSKRRADEVEETDTLVVYYEGLWGIGGVGWTVHAIGRVTGVARTNDGTVLLRIAWQEPVEDAQIFDDARWLDFKPDHLFELA